MNKLETQLDTLLSNAIWNTELSGSVSENARLIKELKQALLRLIEEAETRAEIRAVTRLKSSPLGMVMEAVDIIDRNIETLQSKLEGK